MYSQYIKVPRWIRAIPWTKRLQGFADSSRNFIVFVALPVYIYIHEVNNPSSHIIALKRPKDEEELMAIKRQYTNSVFQRNWEIDQYNYQVPPKYDLAERRAKYPQYYGDRYAGYKKTDV